MNQQDPNSSEHFPRPLDWTTWLLWVMVCGASPVFNAIVDTAFNKQISAMDPRGKLIGNLLIATVLLVPILSPFLQWLVLRRMAPRLGFGLWFAGLLAACVVWMVLLTLAEKSGVGLKDFASHRGLLFGNAIRWQSTRTVMPVAHLLKLPWDTLLPWAAATCGLTSLIPIWILSRRSDRSWHSLLIAAMAGACAAAIVEQLYNIYGPHRIFGSYEPLNGASWLERICELISRAGAGASWGAASALVLVLLSRSVKIETGMTPRPLATDRPAGLMAMALALAVIATSPPFVVYLVRSLGILRLTP